MARREKEGSLSHILTILNLTNSPSIVLNGDFKIVCNNTAFSELEEDIIFSIVGAGGLLKKNIIEKIKKGNNKIDLKIKNHNGFTLEVYEIEINKEKFLIGRLIEKVVKLNECEIIKLLAHELKTPILNISLNIDQMLKRNSTDGDLSNKLLKIKKQILKLSNFVEIFIDFAKCGSGFSPQIEKFAIEELVEHIKENVEPFFAGTNLSFKIEIDKDCPEEVESDFELLSKTLINFITNSIKFTEKGFVKLKISSEKRKLRFSVIDTGSGIDKEILKEIFKPFKRGKCGKRITGSGLGLSVASYFAKLLNGKIEVESEKEKGSVFSLILSLK